MTAVKFFSVPFKPVIQEVSTQEGGLVGRALAPALQSQSRAHFEPPFFPHFPYGLVCTSSTKGRGCHFFGLASLVATNPFTVMFYF